MTTTPNQTAEQLVEHALREADMPWLAETPGSIVAALRAAGLLVGDPTEEQIERADAEYGRTISEGLQSGNDESVGELRLRAMRAALTAADAAPAGRESDRPCPHVPKGDRRRAGECHRCAVEAGWAIAWQEPSAHANPDAASGERVKSQADSFNVTQPVDCDCDAGSGSAVCKKWCASRADPPVPAPDREELIEEAKSRMRGEIHMPGRVFLSGVVDALAAQPVLDPEKDERVLAWEQVAAHPALKRCYGEERPLLHAVLDRLTNLYELEQTVNELAPAPGCSPLDPEKVAEVVEAAIIRSAKARDAVVPCVVRAICEAAKRGELT